MAGATTAQSATRHSTNCGGGKTSLTSIRTAPTLETLPRTLLSSTDIVLSDNHTSIVVNIIVTKDSSIELFYKTRLLFIYWESYVSNLYTISHSQLILRGSLHKLISNRELCVYYIVCLVRVKILCLSHKVKSFTSEDRIVTHLLL